jgi:hypothetical protein
MIRDYCGNKADCVVHEGCRILGGVFGKRFGKHLGFTVKANLALGGRPFEDTFLLQAAPASKTFYIRRHLSHDDSVSSYISLLHASLP